MLNQIKDGNTVKIEGILSEIDLKYGTLTKNGVESKTVGGSIKVRVNTQINKENVELEKKVNEYFESLSRFNDEKCNGCGRWLLIDSENFVRKSRSKDGFSTKCKACDKKDRQKRG